MGMGARVQDFVPSLPSLARDPSIDDYLLLFRRRQAAAGGCGARGLWQRREEVLGDGYGFKNHATRVRNEETLTSHLY